MTNLNFTLFTLTGFPTPIVVKYTAFYQVEEDRYDWNGGFCDELISTHVFTCPVSDVELLPKHSCSAEICNVCSSERLKPWQDQVKKVKLDIEHLNVIRDTGFPLSNIPKRPLTNKENERLILRENELSKWEKFLEARTFETLFESAYVPKCAIVEEYSKTHNNKSSFFKTKLLVKVS
jgi:hypothetical protein